jgi:protocatechuate 4,5-dioxygenase beta chain
MAKITASVYTSHVPAIGAAMDLHKDQEPYWQPLFKGYEKSKEWMKANKPDVIVLVFNDHATAFDLSMIPTFAIGCADSYTLQTKAGDRVLCHVCRGMLRYRRTLRSR